MLAADISGRQEETAAKLGDAVVPFHCDVTKEDQVEAAHSDRSHGNPWHEAQILRRLSDPHILPI